RRLDQPTRNGDKRRPEHPGFPSKFMKHGDAKSLTRSAVYLLQHRSNRVDRNLFRDLKNRHDNFP
ncbi:hypothetical protein, partial [Thauera aromatica]|uniref:hypothetical protein n=1 Tax=Thauera aromatica TaxID=59405 RepID=UPI001FFD4C6E